MADPAAPAEKHPLLLVLARAVHALSPADHRSAIEEALLEHGRGKEFLELAKPDQDAKATAAKAEADRKAASLPVT